MTLKLIFVQLILCLSALACCYGQTNQLINIPVLKENVKVDAALDKFIAQRPKTLGKLSRLGGGYQDGAVKTLLKDSCLLVQLYNSDSLSNVGIIVSTRAKIAIKEEINIFEHLKFKYGCFCFKGQYVFVLARDSFGWLFSKTDHVQTYDFIYYAGNTRDVTEGPVDDQVNYQLKNGTFSDRGAPTIITKKGN